jgi:hypothetical protein
VEPSVPDPVRWVVQPLLDAGLPADQVDDLVFRLAFQATVSAGAVDAEGLVADRPAPVRDAWRLVIGRLLTLGPSA